jgi:hypothetical protein
MNTAFVRKILLLSTYHLCAKPGRDWLDTIIKQSLLWLFDLKHYAYLALVCLVNWPLWIIHPNYGTAVNHAREICRTFREQSIVGFAQIEDKIRGYRASGAA